MKKTTTVSLSGSIFTLEEDAYNVLNGYLKRLEFHFSKEEGKQEIISDIESRIAEHLRETIKTQNQAVDINDINRIIKIMGEPGEIEGEENMKNDYQNDYRSYRRLYRDTDDKIIGGVCAGMGHYWRVEPLLLRIIIILLTVFGVFPGLIIYIILWIVIPPALTNTQKLEMRGEPVTADNIGKSFNK
ncbi:MAG: PspC domain-containing protein [Bacteroidales bacterium]|nr:PspC domain-containing protein [Bacteroidales bacterium]